MMEIGLTRHGKNRMRFWLKHGVTPDDVLQTLRQPEWTEPARKGRANSYRQLADGRILRVTSVEEKGRIAVITLVPQRRRQTGE